MKPIGRRNSWRNDLMGDEVHLYQTWTQVVSLLIKCLLMGVYDVWVCDSIVKTMQHMSSSDQCRRGRDQSSTSR